MRKTTEKKAEELKAGDVLNRWGHECKVMAVERCLHPTGREQILVTTTNAKLGFPPANIVSVFS
jgi:hypothetical protein